MLAAQSLLVLRCAPRSCLPCFLEASPSRWWLRRLTLSPTFADPWGCARHMPAAVLSCPPAVFSRVLTAVDTLDDLSLSLHSRSVEVAAAATVAASLFSSVCTLLTLCGCCIVLLVEHSHSHSADLSNSTQLNSAAHGALPCSALLSISPPLPPSPLAMSSTLALSSPLIGAWADQPVDDRQSALMAATQEAANARRAAAAAKAAAQNKTTAAPAALASTNAAAATSASSSSIPATATDGSTGASSSASSTAAVAPVVYSATFIDPTAPMSAAFQAKHAALIAASAAPSVEGGAPGGWHAVGKLKEMCRTVFERAWGLNGASLTDHEALCEEICLETQCSRKSFCELIYGHSYAAELNDLRALVPNYPAKQKRKREASERGRGGAKKEAGAAAAAAAEHTNDASGSAASSNGHGPTQANGHAAPAASASSAPALVRVPSPTVHLIPVPSSPSLRAHASLPAKLPLQGNTLLTTSPQESHAAPTTQYTFNGQPIQQHPIIHLTHRLIPSVHSNQANAAVLNAVTQQPPAQLTQAQSGAAPAPVPNARFAPPPPSGPRRPSPAPSPLLKPRDSPLSPTGPVPVGGAAGSAAAAAAASSGGVLSPPGRRSVDASSAMRAAVAAANSVSPHLQSLGDPTLNPPLPMVPSLPSLQPVKGSELRNQQAKAVGSPLRQGMNAQMAAAVLQGGSANLPPRASPSLNPMRTPYAHPPLPPQQPVPSAVAGATKPAGIVPASAVPPPSVTVAAAPVALAPMSFAAAVASKTPATTTITPKPSTQAHAAAAPVAAAAAPLVASAPAPPASSDLVSKASARPARVRGLSATMRDEDGSLVPVSPVPEEAELPGDSPQLAAAIPSATSGSAAASASNKAKKPSKKQRAKDKKRAEEAAAAAAAAAPVSTSSPAGAAAVSSSEEESPSGLSRSAKKKSASAAPPKPKRKFSATPPSSPPLYAMSHEAAAALAAASGASSSSGFPSASSVVPSLGTRASPSSSFLRLLLWITASSVLFSVARSLLCTALYGSTSDASGSASQSWSLIAALYVCSVFLFGWLFRCAHEANAGWAALVLELSNQLEKVSARAASERSIGSSRE